MPLEIWTDGSLVPADALIKADSKKRYQQAQEKWNLWCSLGNNWLGYTSYSFATPVTDGKYVYVTTPNNAVAAVDYTGKIAWIIWEYRRGRGCFGGPGSARGFQGVSQIRGGEAGRPRVPFRVGSAHFGGDHDFANEFARRLRLLHRSDGAFGM